MGHQLISSATTLGTQPRTREGQEQFTPLSGTKTVKSSTGNSTLLTQNLRLIMSNICLQIVESFWIFLSLSHQLILSKKKNEGPHVTYLKTQIDKNVFEIMNWTREALQVKTYKSKMFQQKDEIFRLDRWNLNSRL